MPVQKGQVTFSRASAFGISRGLFSESVLGKACMEESCGGGDDCVYTVAINYVE